MALSAAVRRAGLGFRPLGRAAERVGGRVPKQVRQDLLLAVAVTAVTLVRLIRYHDMPNAAAGVVACSGTLCLTWRRLAPVAVLAVSVGSLFLYQALGYSHPATSLALIVAVFTVATIRSAGVAALGSVAAMAAATGSILLRDGFGAANLDDHLLSYLLSIGAACALGYGVQLTRARGQLLEQQAARLDAEHRVREQEMLQQQQNRIARDLHDIVSHQVSVITALAAGAGKVFDSSPERARGALTSIESAGREALSEMRVLLRVLRTDDEKSLTAPQPDLDQLPALAAQFVEAGLPVQLRVEGERRPIPAGPALCAYRIVQEALTNALKHAGPARAVVTVTYEPDALDLEVCDDGRGLATTPGAGHGLGGMRERAALLGGRVTLSAAPGGGVRVHARLPIGGDRP